MPFNIELLHKVSTTSFSRLFSAYYSVVTRVNGWFVDWLVCWHCSRILPIDELNLSAKRLTQRLVSS